MNDLDQNCDFCTASTGFSLCVDISNPSNVNWNPSTTSTVEITTDNMGVDGLLYPTVAGYHEVRLTLWKNVALLGTVVGEEQSIFVFVAPLALNYFVVQSTIQNIGVKNMFSL